MEPYIRPVYFPGGVADSAHTEGYLRLYQTGIHAVSLVSGEILWSLDRAAQPILVLAELVVALVQPEDTPDELRVLVLDRNRKGGVVREAGPIVFPAWVRPGVVPRQNFHYRVEGEGNDTLLIHWHALGEYQGGAYPSPEIQRQSGRDTSGTARVPLRRGKVKQLPAEETDADRSVRELVSELPSSAPYQREGTGSAWSDRAWRMKDRPLLAFLQTEGDNESKERRVVLKTRQVGERIESVELARLSSPESFEAGVTQDGEFVALSVFGGAAGTSHHCRLFSVATGETLAEWQDTRSVSAFSILGDRVFLLSRNGDTHLEARNLLDGKVCWTTDFPQVDTTPVSPRALRQKSAQ